MRIWNKIKYPLLIGLITALMIWIRYLTMAVPSWVDAMLYYPLIAFRIICKDTIANIVIIAVCAGAVMLVPYDWKWNPEGKKLRRFVVRPAVCVLVMLCVSGWMIHSNDGWEDRIWEKKVDAFSQDVSAFLDVADEVILHNSSTHNYTPYFKDERIRCECGTYHDVIMIDYDTMRIAFLRHGGISDFFVYDLKPGALTSQNDLVQTDLLLEPSQTRLVTYYPDGQNTHRTSAIELFLADGTVYSTTDTPDNHWDNAFLALYAGSGDHFFPVGEPHPKP